MQYLRIELMRLQSSIDQGQCSWTHEASKRPEAVSARSPVSPVTTKLNLGAFHKDVMIGCILYICVFLNVCLSDWSRMEPRLPMLMQPFEENAPARALITINKQWFDILMVRYGAVSILFPKLSNVVCLLSYPVFFNLCIISIQYLLCYCKTYKIF